MQKTWKIVLVIAVVLVVAGGVYYFKPMWEYSPQTEGLNTESIQNSTTQTPTTNQTVSTVGVEGETPTIIDNASEEDLRGLHSSIKHTATGLEYENSIYRFSLVFPKSWGDIKEKVSAGPTGSKILEVVKLTAQNDGERYIQIDVVETKYKDAPSVIDAPHAYINGNLGYSFYWAGSGDNAGAPGMEDQKYSDIQQETKSISQTFRMF